VSSLVLRRTLQLRGGAFLEDANQRRGHCAETGSWLGTYGLPHTDAHNLTVVFPTDTQHALKIGKGASWPPKVENGYQIDNEFLAEDSWLQRQPLVDWVRILVSSPAQQKGRFLYTSTHVDSLLDILSYLQDKEWGKCCLVMLDPDAPRPRSEELGGSACGSLGPWLHWLVVDAVGTPEHVSWLCALALIFLCACFCLNTRVCVCVGVCGSACMYSVGSVCERLMAHSLMTVREGVVCV